MGKPDPCACSTFVGLQGLICQQEARDEGNPAHHITYSDWTRSRMETWCWGRFEVLDFYNITLPASSIGQVQLLKGSEAQIHTDKVL